jgi:GT2 family glycosyltransferase
VGRLAEGAEELVGQGCLRIIVATSMRANMVNVPTDSHPDVSIVVVTYEGAELVETALRALLDNTEPCYELILIDNGSSDRTPALLRRVGNATVVLNERNTGFGAANNEGADRACGRYVLFLNQDAFVHRGWLPPLLERIESDDAIGAVGPMLLNPDGSLQCAGAMIFRTGDTRCYGVGDDPELPEYCLARDVDYLSGACLLTRRSAFTDVGGFSPAYGLAYFEDADLCLSLATRGYRSVYEPRSRVTHVRGRPSDALLELAARNRTLFERRWREVLASRPLPPTGASESVDNPLV